jgi:hypothetical protein
MAGSCRRSAPHTCACRDVCGSARRKNLGVVVRRKRVMCLLGGKFMVVARPSSHVSRASVLLTEIRDFRVPRKLLTSRRIYRTTLARAYPCYEVRVRTVQTHLTTRNRMHETERFIQTTYRPWHHVYVECCDEP